MNGGGHVEARRTHEKSEAVEVLMNIWELERRIIDIIGIELQVPRGQIGPRTHILDDLKADWLSIERLIAAFEAQLGVRVYQELFTEHRVWDVVKECHNRRSGRDSMADQNRKQPGRQSDEYRATEVMLAWGLRPQRETGVHARRRAASA
jgi:hypothetical protein